MKSYAEHIKEDRERDLNEALRKWLTGTWDKENRFLWVADPPIPYGEEPPQNTRLRFNELKVRREIVRIAKPFDGTPGDFRGYTNGEVHIAVDDKTDEILMAVLIGGRKCLLP